MQELPSFLLPAQLAQTEQALAVCNETSARFGLCLSPQEIRALAQHRFAALQSAGRLELSGAGVLPVLIDAFCDSPYLAPSDYAQTLDALQEQFYAFKNDCEALSDEELARAMRLVFDRVGGDLKVLADADRTALITCLLSGAQPQVAGFDLFDEEAPDDD